MSRLRVSLLGLGETGRQICAAVVGHPGLELVAVADRNREATARVAEQFGAKDYTDYRSIIVESRSCGVDALFVALEPHEAQEYLRVAVTAERPVLACCPVARTFQALSELVELFEGSAATLSASCPWAFEPAYMRLANPKATLGRILWATAEVSRQAGNEAERLESGRRVVPNGGVLLLEAYEAIDALVKIVGLPDEVYAAAAANGAAGGANYEFEDCISLTARHAGGGISTITANRAAAEQHWRISLGGTEASAVITRESLVVIDRGGMEKVRSVVRTRNPFGPLVDVFASALAAGVARLPGPVREQLPTMATIGAAQLSVRTGQAESPQRLLEMVNIR